MTPFVNRLRAVGPHLKDTVGDMVSRAASAIAVLLVLVVFGASACSPQIRTHGNMVDPDALAKINPGSSTTGEVLSLLGSPSSEANFGQRTWYYIGQRTERQAFLKPEIIERKVVYVDFDQSGLVDTIGSLDLEDGKKLAFITRETPTAGQKVTLIKQLLGNIGRFNPEE
ncbi:MAG: outer membrane protein assembly factor BamE [Alphaproteobacteria bacterium]|nr:outer membrane protein assembly factor BamE [Alphaproteobacteria bacterium]